MEKEAEKTSYWLWIQTEKMVGITHPFKDNNKGWQGDITIYATAPQTGDGAEGETSVNGSHQLTTQQLPTLAPEEVQKSARIKHLTCVNLCKQKQPTICNSLTRPS